MVASGLFSCMAAISDSAIAAMSSSCDMARHQLPSPPTCHECDCRSKETGPFSCPGADSVGSLVPVCGQFKIMLLIFSYCLDKVANIQIITLKHCLRLIAVSLLGVSHVLLVDGGFLEAAAASFAIHGQCPAPASATP